MDAPKEFQASDRIVGGSPPPSQLRNFIKRLHDSIRTETAYLGWIKRYTPFHGKRHLGEMGAKGARSISEQTNPTQASLVDQIAPSLCV